MLIDFKIRALFIWTDPYLPDLSKTDMDSLKQNLCLTPDHKMVLPIKVANYQKITLAS